MPRGGARENYKTEAICLLRVRCLGPSLEEHWFNSPSKYLRICPKCQALQRNASSITCVRSAEQSFHFLHEP